MEVLAKRLKERARELGLSDAEVARRAGLEPPSYGHYVTGERRPNYWTLLRLCEVLATSPNYLLGFDDKAGLPADAARLLSAFALLDDDGRRLATALVETLVEQSAQTPSQRSPSPSPPCIEGTATPVLPAPPKPKRRKKEPE